jgi:hypothetical protein
VKPIHLVRQACAALLYTLSLKKLYGAQKLLDEVLAP